MGYYLSMGTIRAWVTTHENTVYRTPTNTDIRTISFTPPSTCKSGTLQCLEERVRRICDKEGIKEEIAYGMYETHASLERMDTHNISSNET